jgi:hypothetical protein
MRSRTSWEVAEEVKENRFPTECVVGGNSSGSPVIYSGIELVAQEEKPLANLEAMHKQEDEEE